MSDTIEIIRRYQADINNECINRSKVNIYRNDTGRYIQVDIFDCNIAYNIEGYQVKVDCNIGKRLFKEITDGIVVRNNSLKFPLKEISKAKETCRLNVRLIKNSEEVTILQLEVKIKDSGIDDDTIVDENNKPVTIREIINEIVEAREDHPSLMSRLNDFESRIAQLESILGELDQELDNILGG